MVDTNVLLSAALRDRLPEKVVRYVATNATCRWLATSEIHKEYHEVLKRPKFSFSPEVLRHWTGLIDAWTVMVASPAVAIDLPRDPKDSPFLSAALATGPDYLITGDKDLLDAKISIPTRIVTVAQFAAEIGIS